MKVLIVFLLWYASTPIAATSNKEMKYFTNVYLLSEDSCVLVAILLGYE